METLGLIFAASYLLGSIPWSHWLGKYLGQIDERYFGQKHLSVLHILRLGGLEIAVLVLVADFLTGWTAVYLAQTYRGTDISVVLTALMVLAGHCWSIFLGFRGGGGLTTALGVMAFLALPVAQMTAAIWVAAVLLTRSVTRGGIIASLMIPILMWVYQIPEVYFIFSVIAVGILLFQFWPELKTGRSQTLMGEPFKY